MNITEARIDHLSDLARLSLPGGEKEEIARELERILDYMAVLDGLDTAGAEPLSHVFPLKNVLRPDETAPSADRAFLLARGLSPTDGAAQTFPPAAPAWPAQSASNLSTCGVLPAEAGLTETLTRGEAAQLLCAAQDLLDSRDTGWF